MKGIDQTTAAEYAAWFRCLSDPTRIRILSLVAASGPLTVGEIVREVGRSQSTVSTHLRVLADERFVFCEADGTRTLVRANQSCMTALPAAASEIMGVST